MAGLLLVSIVTQARSEQQRWGSTVGVVVVEHEVALGASVAEGHFALAQMPRFLVPDDALLSLPDSADSVVRSLRSGDVVTERDLRSMRGSIAMPDGHRAMSIPQGPTIPRVVAGDVVDIYLVGASAFDDDAEASDVVDDPGLVVEVTSDSILLALPEEQVATVAKAVTEGRLLLALR